MTTTTDPRLRVTLGPAGTVLVERLRAHGSWEVRTYREDAGGNVVEVRPNGSLLPMGPGLVHSRTNPLRIALSLLDTVTGELGPEGVTTVEPV